MQTRKSIQELAALVDYNSSIKRDYVIPSGMIRMAPSGSMTFNYDYYKDGNKGVFDHEFYDLGVVAHEQLASKLDIPKKYYDRMLSNNKELLSENVNAWLDVEDDRKMVRTLGSKVRAILSDKYQPFDNDIVLGSILPVLMEHKDFYVVSSELTERRMYLSVVSNRLEGEVKKGEVVQQGIIIGNSEVGQGSFFIDPMIYILSCLNGAVMQRSLRKYHVGKRIEGEDFSVYRPETILADQNAFLLKIRDVVANAFDELAFRDLLGSIHITTENKIIRDDIQGVVEDVTKKFDLSVHEKNSVLKNLITSGDLTQWGMSQAVTATANVITEYDRIVDLQRIGGKIIDLSPKDWHELAA